MRKFLSLILAAIMVTATAAGAMAAVTISANYAYDASFDLTLTQTGVGDVECGKYQYTKQDMAAETDVFYAGLPNPGSYSGGEILSVFTVYGVASPDLVDAVYYANVPAAVGSAAGSLYLYFVNEDFSDNCKLTTVAAMAVGAKYSSDKKMLAVTPLPGEAGAAFWNPGANMGTRLILVKGVGGTPVPAAPKITSASIKSAAVGKAYSFEFTATGDRPLTWSIVKGTLPDGLKFADGVISGTPTTAGGAAFTVEAKNAAGSDAKDFTLNVSSYKEQRAASADIVGDKPAGVSGVTGSGSEGNEAAAAAYLRITGAAKVGDIDAANISDIPTSFIVNVEHDETASGDITLKVTLDSPIKLLDGVKYYAVIPEKTDSEKFATFAADEVSESSLTFTVKDFSKYFTEAPVFVAAVKAGSPTPDGGSSSGGCAAGASALALLAFAPFTLRRKK